MEESAIQRSTFSMYFPGVEMANRETIVSFQKPLSRKMLNAERRPPIKGNNQADMNPGVLWEAA